MGHRKGFTLIEVLVIIAVLLAMIKGFTGFTENTLINTEFNSAVAEIKQVILFAENRALKNYKNTNSGVHFDTDTYTIFYSTSYSASDPDNETYDLPGLVELNNISFDGDAEVTFQKYSGLPIDAGSLDIVSDNGDTATISVDANGVVSITYN